MYKVFKPIPAKVRRDAIAIIAKFGVQRGDRLYWMARTYLPHSHCPLGVVNKMLALRAEDRRDAYDKMPTDGIAEKTELLRRNIDIEPADADRFIKDVDSGKFTTVEELAAAMGVKAPVG